MLPIERGIPIAPKSSQGGPGRGGGMWPKYPFKQMEVGDSFFVPCEEREMRKRLSSLLCLAKLVAYVDENAFFEARRVEDGVRVWRTR